MEFSEWENQSLPRPFGEASNPSGYGGSSLNLGDVEGGEQQSSTELARLAARVMADPVLFERLRDRVYELMLADVRDRQERSRSYGRLL